MTLVATPYCTEADMTRKFSAVGITSFADHDQSGSSDTGVVDDAINEATEEINLYCYQYSVTAMASSTLINRWATTMAVFHLCELRGMEPPVGLANAYQRIIDALTKVQTGALTLPGVALANHSLPTFSNVQVDRRYPYSTVRTIPSNSSNAPTKLTQDTVLFPVID